MHLQQSSRRQPCPVCGRNVDGDCRFSDELILCHSGTRFHPPQNLRPGDVIGINGVCWALIRTDAGFDGAAHEFRPDRATRQTRGFHGRRRQQRQAGRLLHEVLRDIDAALSVPEFMQSAPAELRESIRLIEVAAGKAEALLPALRGRLQPPQISLLAEAIGELTYQRLDADHFRHHYLDEGRHDQ